MTTRNAALPQFQTRAAFEPSTLNVDARTIEVIWSTGARVRRESFWDGPWYEELSLRSDHVDLSRLNSGAPILNVHSRYELEDVLGVVERSWLVSEREGRALIRFSKRDDVEKIFQDVKDNIIRNVSVGYSIRKLVKVEEIDGVPVMRAEDWQPFEISLVPVGADAGAGTRHAERMFNCIIENVSTEARNVDETKKTEGNEAPAQNTTGQDEHKRAVADAIAAERKRASEINDLCSKHRVGEQFAARMIADGAGIDAVRAAILDELATRDAPTQSRGAHAAQIVRDEVDTRRRAVENALLARHDSVRFKLTDEGRQYRGLSLLETARELLAARGENVRGLSRNEVAERALHTTSDFPYILANVASKTLRSAYEAAPQTFRPFVRTVELPDFKQTARVSLGDAPSLERVNEHGEYKRGSIGEGREAYQLATYGKVIGVTRQVIINDDIGMFTRIPEAFARAAADLESDLVWAQVTGTALMADGKQLFHADHKNIVTPAAALAIESLGRARSLLRKQVGLAGRLLNLQAQFLIVPVALETVADQLVSAVVAAEAGNVNPFAGRLQVIADPRLDAVSETAWYLAATPAQVDTIELAYLAGEAGPYTQTREGFDVDGTEIKVRLDVAAKAIEHRWIVRNAGVA